MKSFGERLRSKRLEKGWTQEYLGQLVGLQKSAIAKYENGRILNVSTEIADRFATALGVSAHDLLDTFERNLYALDIIVTHERAGVKVNVPEIGDAFFTHDEWDTIKSEGKVAAVLTAAQKFSPENKKAPAGFGEDLSGDKRYLIDTILSLTDDEVRSLRTIVDQVLALRG